MGNIALPGWPVAFPYIRPYQGQAATFGASTIDADGEKVAFVFRAPEAGTINAAGFLCGTVTQSPTNGLKVSLQDLDASGDPDGTADQFRNVPTGEVATDTWVTTGLLTNDGTDTGTKRTVTQGQLLALVIEFETFVASDSVNINRESRGGWGLTNGGVWVPYVDSFTAAWSHTTAGLVNFAIQYSDSEWKPIFAATPVSAVSATILTSATSPDEVGVRVTTTVPMRAVGFCAYVYFQNSSATAKLHLMDSTETDLATATISNPAQSGASLNAYSTLAVPFDDVANVDMPAGTYYITIEATGTGQVRNEAYSVPSATFQTACPWGASTAGVTITDGGAATATTTVHRPIALLVDATSGGGGGNVIIRRSYDD